MTTTQNNGQETFSLLIWEIVPEETKLYLIPNSTANQYRSQLEMAHGNLINDGEMNEGMDFLNAALCPNEDCVRENQKDIVGIFIPFLKSSKRPIKDIVITNVYLSGFYLSGFVL